VSIEQGLLNAGKAVVFRQGCNVNDSDTSMIAAAVRAARAADVAVLAVGETADMSGEAHRVRTSACPGCSCSSSKPLRPRPGAPSWC